MEMLKERLARRCPELVVLEQATMCRHTTFRVGGPVPLMALPKTPEQAAAAVETAAELDIVPFFLGNGSNLLVSDRGVDVFVIKTSGLIGAKADRQGITAQSGCTLAHLACLARENALAGLAFAHGIPGTLGGAVVMNAGAYGGEMAQVVESVTALDRQGQTETLTQMDFSYRHSAFSDGSRMILSARLHLSLGDGDQIQREMEQLMERRRSKQPLELPSAGSTFRRPKEGYAAALIDQCGLKGLTVGGAQVSEKHAGFIVNRGGATCRDILILMDQVRSRVLEQTGVALEPEVKLLGEEFAWNS